MIAVLTIAALSVVLVTSLGVALARRVVVDRPRRKIRVLAASNSTVTLPRSALTHAPGNYSLRFNDGQGHALIGAVLKCSDTIVERQVLTKTSQLAGGSSVIWSGQVVSGPGELGEYDDVEIPSANGTVHAWHISPAASSYPVTWAIHIHGIRSSREGVLRSVPAASELGMTSLVVTFAGHDALEGCRPTSGLGLREWQDVEAGIAYAAEQGADRVVLFGWSMGATAALLAVERSPLASYVCGLVLVDPATNWRKIIQSAARRAHLTAFVGELACMGLSSPVLSRLSGAHSSIDFESLDWTTRRRVHVPTLVMHSAGDETVPLQLSKQFVTAQAPYARLVVLPDAPHGMGYNTSPKLFNAAIAEWWSGHSPK